MSPKMMFSLAALLPVIILAIELQMARNYYSTMHDLNGWEAVNRWFKRRRVILGGVVVIYLASGGMLLYTNLVRLPGLRHESRQYVESASNYLKNNKYQEAGIELRNAIRKNPEDSEAHLVLARVQSHLGQTREAVESYQKVISLDTTLYEPHLELGWLAFELKNSDLALAEASKAAQLQPDKTEPHLLLAEIYSATGMSDPALEQCRSILGKQFAAPETRQRLIGLFMKHRAYAEALQVTVAGLNIAPTDTTLKIRHAEALEGLKRTAEAETVLQAAATADPASPAPYSALGDLRAGHGDYVAALKWYEEALKRAPDNDLAMNNIASLTADHGYDLNRAATLASRLYVKYPENPTAADTLGWTLFRQGKIALAVPLLKQGVAGMPDNPLHRYHLGVALFKAGNQTAGRKELEEARRISGNFDGATKARTHVRGATS